MKSNEVLRAFLKKHGYKILAAELGLHLSFLYKWCEQDGGKASGAINPLERLAQLHRLTGDVRPVQWLCAQAGGFYQPNPPVQAVAPEELLPATVLVLGKLARLSSAVSEAVKEGRVTKAEAAELRSRWDELKADLERFVSECDQDRFRPLLNISIEMAPRWR